MNEERAPARVHLTDRPTGPKETPTYDILRTPTSGAMNGIILSTKVQGCPTHWYRNRTRPHTEGFCEACEAKMPFNWHGYFFLLAPATRRIVLMEITRGPLPTFEEYIERHGTLRGTKVKLWRKGKRENSQVKAELAPGPWSHDQLPTCPDLQVQLARIWGGGLNGLERGNPDGPTEVLQLEFIDLGGHGT